MTIRGFRPRERCLVNGYLVEVERHARRTSFVRVLDQRLLDQRLHFRPVVQIDRKTKAERLP